MTIDIQNFLNDILFWPRANLPTAPQMLVLEHLARDGEPRLYLYGYEGGYLRAGVSNSESVAGWELQCDIEPLFRDWRFAPLLWWVERDDALSGDKKREYAVYKLSRVGRVVIEWAHSQGRYGAKTPRSRYGEEDINEE